MIEFTNIINLWLFILLMVGTPGPANLLTMSAGAQYGVAKCMPFNFGLIGGKLILNISMGLGLGLLLANIYLLQFLFKFISAGYMIYLAFTSWNSVSQGDEEQVIMGWRKGLLVHPLNPKAWVMIVIAWTEFGPNFGSFYYQIIIISLSFACFQLVLHTSWTFAGAILSKAFPNSLLLNRALILITISVVIWAVLI